MNKKPVPPAPGESIRGAAPYEPRMERGSGGCEDCPELYAEGEDRTLLYCCGAAGPMQGYVVGWRHVSGPAPVWCARCGGAGYLISPADAAKG